MQQTPQHQQVTERDSAAEQALAPIPLHSAPQRALR